MRKKDVHIYHAEYSFWMEKNQLKIDLKYNVGSTQMHTNTYRETRVPHLTSISANEQTLTHTMWIWAEKNV